MEIKSSFRRRATLANTAIAEKFEFEETSVHNQITKITLYFMCHLDDLDLSIVTEHNRLSARRAFHKVSKGKE